MPRAKEYNENEVLEKAMELFWKKGYHATSIQDLVSYVGIHRGSLYSEFGDKKQLFDASLEHYREINTKKVKAFLEAQPSVKQGFKKLLESAIEENLEDQSKKGCFMVNAATELASGDDEIKKILQENHSTFTTLFQNFIESGMEKGEIDKEKNARSIAQLLFTFFNGIRVVGKIHNDKEDLLDSVNIALEIL